jgi:Copper type II ascorbate-dependent monooxygenase, C-terminal domain
MRLAATRSRERIGRQVTTRLSLVACALLMLAACGKSTGTSGPGDRFGGAGTAPTSGAAGMTSTTGGGGDVVIVFDGGAGQSSAAGTTGAAGTGLDAGTVSYYKDVQPILSQHCETCHNAGGIGPFVLGTYEEAKQVAPLMAAATSQHIMPPWMPAAGCGDIRDARVITDHDIAVLGAWSAQGAPAGNPAEQPPAPASTAPDLGTPSATLDPGADYHPNDLLTDDYHCTLIDPGLTQAQDLIGFNVHPGSAATVHHVLLFSVTQDQLAAVQAKDAAEAGPGWTCFGGTGVDATPTVGGWVPGSGETAFPAPTGIHLAAGTQIVMQIHYNLLTTKHVTDHTTADLFYAKTPVPLIDRAAIAAVANTTFLIPAGVASQTVSADLPINSSFNLWGVVPHMHLHGTQIKVQVKHADGTSECAVEIPKWNFHWQQFYYYEQPTKVVKGDTIHLECTYDNSAANQPVINGIPMTPAPLRWGEKTTDEMCLNYLYFTIGI